MDNNNRPTMQNDGAGSGIFVGEATIIDARSVSNEDIFKNGKPVDVGIEFTLDIGKEFTPKFTVSGNFKFNEATQKWEDSSTVRVKIALNNLKVKWKKFGPNNEVPQEVLDQCKGLKIVRLQYPYGVYTEGEKAGKPKTRTFDYFLLASTPDAKRLVSEKFKEAVQKGYVKVYDTATEFPGAPAVPAEPVEDRPF
jgi:hypothetical protein